jgi:hypothetical protein
VHKGKKGTTPIAEQKQGGAHKRQRAQRHKGEKAQRKKCSKDDKHKGTKGTKGTREQSRANTPRPILQQAKLPRRPADSSLTQITRGSEYVRGLRPSRAWAGHGFLTHTPCVAVGS